MILLKFHDGDDPFLRWSVCCGRLSGELIIYGWMGLIN